MRGEFVHNTRYGTLFVSFTFFFVKLFYDFLHKNEYAQANKTENSLSVIRNPFLQTLSSAIVFPNQ